MSKYLSYLSITLIPSLLFVAGCSQQRCVEDVRAAEKMTVGKVQRCIRVGMTNAEVVENLGSPNIVSTDEQRREVWVYDKVATEHVYSQSAAGGGIGALILGSSGGGVGSFSGSKQVGARSTTQRTLTVIVKYDNRGAVRDIAYHASQF